jgi:hypothetical protein
MKAELKARMETMKKVKDAIRNPYAFPGGYEKIIIMNDGSCICAECAKEEFEQVAHDTIKGWSTGWDVAGIDLYFEGEEYCSHCSKPFYDAET